MQAKWEPVPVRCFNELISIYHIREERKHNFPKYSLTLIVCRSSTDGTERVWCILIKTDWAENNFVKNRERESHRIVLKDRTAWRSDNLSCRETELTFWRNRNKYNASHADDFTRFVTIFVRSQSSDRDFVGFQRLNSDSEKSLR